MVTYSGCESIVPLMVSVSLEQADDIRFPIQEDGMNFLAQRLMPHEISAMKADAQVIRRIIQSYKIMLEFYGMQLQSEETGLLGRALPPESCSLRYKNLLRK